MSDIYDRQKRTTASKTSGFLVLEKILVCHPADFFKLNRFEGSCLISGNAANGYGKQEKEERYDKRVVGKNMLKK